MSPPRKTVQQYEAEAKQTINGCLISRIGLPRKIYQLRHGQIYQKGVQVCHTCDNPACIEDTHHWLGTQQENMADASNKNRLTRSQKTKEKISSSTIGKRLGNTNAKGHKHTSAWKTNHSNQMRGNSYAKGNKLSELTRARMSTARLGNTNAKSLKGKTKSKQHKEAISKGLQKWYASHRKSVQQSIP